MGWRQSKKQNKELSASQDAFTSSTLLTAYPYNSKSYSFSSTSSLNNV